MASAEQDQWVEIADALRGQLARIVPLAPAMSPEELQALVASAWDVYWLDAQARAFDEAAEEVRAVAARNSQYGS